MESDSETHTTCNNNFDARKYLEVYYGVDPKTQQVDVESKFVLRFLHDVFASGRVAGDSLIEIGAGPVLYHIVSASERFNTIFLTDYCEERLACTSQHGGLFFMEEQSAAFQGCKCLFNEHKGVCRTVNFEVQRQRKFSPTVKSSPKDKMEMMKKNIKLMKCDVTMANPLQTNTVPQADCVIVAACLTCACKTPNDFQNALNNISSLVKPGGYLIIVDYLGASYYLIGQRRLNILLIDETIVKQNVKAAGFCIEEFEVGNNFGIPHEIFNCKEVFCLLAKK
ncbi:hypothetical protein XELAEV_18037441mg [Xenopus laevis]|uniref:Uncharacterized protein n=1 Tax=Xenopus laevis TaxID=8355 RepID=A0A974HA65_XENLA|nr:hypothetical protein XELAEV_18037441mg [Xenopus laevis]